MPILIKQPPVYFDYTKNENDEVWDRSLIKCPCECRCLNLCEKGVGLCDPCLNNISIKLSNDLDKILYESKEAT